MSAPFDYLGESPKEFFNQVAYQSLPEDLRILYDHCSNLIGFSALRTDNGSVTDSFMIHDPPSVSRIHACSSPIHSS